MRSLSVALGALVFTVACGDTADDTVDAAPPGPDAGPSCLDAGHAAGERYPAGDGCNACTCEADGTTSCSTRTCVNQDAWCEYDGTAHPYAVTFPSADGCNECVCATSGLACTERPACAPVEADHAILLESLDAPCGDPAFTPRVVLDDLPYAEVTAAFPYQHDREKYPETLPPTTATFRVWAGDGYAVCRIPTAGQEAIDLEAVAEFVTADGSFDEGLHAYLRKDRTGFVDAWYVVGSIPPGELTGDYDPACIDFLGTSFAAQIDRDGSAFGSAYKTCETDFYLEVGTWSVAAP
ncbi:MAG: hypothetical protein R2939_17605 [Kofleriaceae bacterium]